MERFCKDLKEHAINITNNEKKINDTYTGKYRGAAHSISNLRHKTRKEFLVMFHNGSTYDYHFISKSYWKNLKVDVNVYDKI